MKELYDVILAKIEEFKTDGEKAVAGNKSAGLRARKATLELTKLFKEFRAKSLGKE